MGERNKGKERECVKTERRKGDEREKGWQCQKAVSAESERLDVEEQERKKKSARHKLDMERGQEEERNTTLPQSPRLAPSLPPKEVYQPM